MSRFLNFINEKYLTSEFKFGFELEAVITNFEKNETPFQNYTESVFGKDKVQLRDDGSINAKGYNNTSIEYPIGPLQVTPENIKKCINYLNSLSKYGVITNESCGFHVHISWPDLNELQQIWVIMNLAMNTDFTNTFTKNYQTNYWNGFKFFNKEYANPDFLKHIRNYILKYKKGTTSAEHILEDLNKLLNRHKIKYQLLNPHSQGTLEWRGPRNFLNGGYIGYIEQFFVFLLKYINIVKSALEFKPIEGVYSNLSFEDFKAAWDDDSRYTGSAKSWIYDKKENEYSGIFSKHFLKTITSKDVAIFYKKNPWIKTKGLKCSYIRFDKNYIATIGNIKGNSANDDKIILSNIRLAPQEYRELHFENVSISNSILNSCQLDKCNISSNCSIYNSTLDMCNIDMYDLKKYRDCNCYHCNININNEYKTPYSGDIESLIIQYKKWKDYKNGHRG